MDKKIELSFNHKRSVSATLQLIEKIVTELERELTCITDKSMYKIKKNLDQSEMERYIEVIRKIKSHILQLSEKYDLHPLELNLDQEINAKKSSMWAILCDTTSKRLKGYGEFPKDHAELDSDIQTLQDLIASI